MYSSVCSLLLRLVETISGVLLEGGGVRVAADLEEDGLALHPPEVGDRVTRVSSTWQQLQGGVAAGTQLLCNTHTWVKVGGAWLKWAWPGQGTTTAVLCAIGFTAVTVSPLDFFT